MGLIEGLKDLKRWEGGGREELLHGGGGGDREVVVEWEEEVTYFAYQSLTCNPTVHHEVAAIQYMQ